jgi:phage FluMu gp28-like protein
MAQNHKTPDTKRFFMGYQIRWLVDRSRIKLWEKSRRIGATYVQSYEDVEDIVAGREYTPSRPVRKVYFTSADESAAREYIDYCADWAKLFNMAAEKKGEEILDAEKDIKALCIEFKNGGKIYALTSNPKRFRSKGGKVVWDEAAWHDDQNAMWKAAQPTAMWGYPIRILSTHHGKQSLFYRFCEDVRAKKINWSAHRTTIVDAVNNGLVDKIYGRLTSETERAAYLEDLRKNCRSDDIWREDYMCEPVDAATAFLPYETIAAAASADILLPWDQLEITKGDLYAGWDIARHRHLSVFWILERLGDVRYTRFVKDFEKATFAEQMKFLQRVMKLPGLRRVCIDKTGMGIPIEEEARTLYGAYRVEGVTFTSATKEALAMDAKNALEDRRSRIPDMPVVADSFHSIKRIVTTAGNARFDADSTDATGHADHFWAFALAEHAAKSNAGPVTIGTRKRQENDFDVMRY